MKNLKYLSFLTIFLLFSACEEDNYEFGPITSPTNLQVNVEIVGSSSENPNGDGTGVVYFTASAENAISYEFIIDGESIAVTTSGILEHTFYTVGVNSYEVIVIASGTAGNSTSTALLVEVLATYEPPADLVEVLTGGSSKTWRVKSDVQNHFGLGPPGGLIPCEWYGAGPEEKTGVGTYDDRWIINSDGTINHVTNGTIFGRTAQVHADLGNNGTGSTDGADILNYEYADYTESWVITDPGQISINLSGNMFFTYYTGGDHVYEIWDYNDNELYLKTLDGAAEFTWWFILVSD
ncbi:MAG: glucan endo-1,3-beta-D-glucosidase [Flavobacteriaceae bacterium]|nr:glucan endo-1,3-beta-D-glucosidase [Flavobacteriaceae bacterium]|tara:strand:- start:1283 stop:2164 length:882 start_codon:yes stop_codon:yes gene_type:complete